MAYLNSLQQIRQNSRFVLTVYLLSVIYVMFYWLIDFSFADESLCIILSVYAINKKVFARKEVLRFLSIVLLYMLYSLIIDKNVPKAIFHDLLQFLKPFFCFYIAYNLPINIEEWQKKCLRCLCYILAIATFSTIPFVEQTYHNSAGLYMACTHVAFLYLIMSKREKKDILIFLVILIPGFFALKSKFYAEIVCYLTVLFVFKSKVKISIKTIAVFVVMIVIAIWVNYEKFSNYFIVGEENAQVRTFLYMNSSKILLDYFPLGTGFGTFGTDASGRYYSPVYHEYDMSWIWGCSPGDYGTDHSFFGDTFFPALIGEFGAVGVVLFFLFWVKRWKESKKIDLMSQKMFLILFLYFMVEDVANTAFLGPTSVPGMIALGLILNRYQQNAIVNNSTDIQR